MEPDFVVQVKCSIYWLNRVLRVFLDLYTPDFPKSTSKYMFCTKEVRKHGLKCFTTICNFKKQFLVKEVFGAAQSFKFFQTDKLNVSINTPFVVAKIGPTLLEFFVVVVCCLILFCIIYSLCFCETWIIAFWRKQRLSWPLALSTIELNFSQVNSGNRRLHKDRLVTHWGVTLL